MIDPADTTRPVDSIIIVRRKHDDDHGHHGGAWKIAYADFVTAMMAFFLVMWLINAANEKTKAQVASYFNPIKLTDASTSKKGINEPAKVTADGDKSEKSAASGDQSNIKSEKPPEKDADPTQFTADEIFKNPYGILAQLASQAGEGGAPPGHSTKGLAIVEIVEPGRKGGEAIRDPFDPLAWKLVKEPVEKAAGPKTAEDGAATEMAEPPKEVLQKVEEKKAAVEGAVAAKIETAAGVEGAAKPPESAAKQPAGGTSNQIKDHEARPIPPSPPSVTAAQKPEAGPAKQASVAAPVEKKEATKFEIASAKAATAVRERLIKDLKKFDPEKNPSLDVKQTKEGVLISLTDSMSFDMFALGSAEPKPQLVLLMEKVAATLHDYKGRIVIRGHTDSRRFRNRDYDNWRLSTARAQMAYYMLIRAGVAETSVERIEGYADRDLKRPDQPEAAENRRIEILLKVNEP